MEEWKTVDEYPNYSVSNLGRIKTSSWRNTGAEKMLTPVNNGSDYLYIKLYNDNGMKRVGVHRLVALAFITNPHNYRTVDHIDRNRQNNNASNLRWVPWNTQVENKRYKKSSIGERYISSFRDGFTVRVAFNTLEQAKAARDLIIRQPGVILTAYSTD